MNRKWQTKNGKIQSIYPSTNNLLVEREDKFNNLEMSNLSAFEKTIADAHTLKEFIKIIKFY